MSFLFLNQAAGNWSEAIWRASWQGGLAVFVVWMLTRAWQSMPPILRCWLWRFVFIKFVVAFFCPTALELAWLPARAASSIVEPPGVDSLTTSLITHSRETFGPDSNAPEMDSSSRWPAPSAWLMLLWLTGVGIYLMRLEHRWRTTRRLRLGTNPAGSDLLDTVAALSERMRMARPPEVRTSSGVPGPLVLGVFRPTVILPTTLLERRDKAELQLVLAHELAHCRRWDLLWDWLPTLVRGLFFFHPLVWLACREARLASEIACDRLAIEDTDRPASAYADVLLRVAVEVSRCGCPRPLGAVGAFESYQSLKRRLTALATLGTMPRRQLRLTLVPVFAVAVALIIPWRLTSQTMASPTSDEPLVTGQIIFTYGKPQAAAVPGGTTPSSEFAHAIRFEQGKTEFLDGDKIAIQEVRGTADKIAPGNIYWIRGTYKLASHPQASLSAYVTARLAANGTTPTLQVQTTIVKKGEGTFSLYLPMTYPGWPHVSFYPAEGGEVFGGTYFGTGDAVLKQSITPIAQQVEKALKGPDQKREARRRRWQLNFDARGPVDHLNQFAGLGAILAVPEEDGGFRVFSELRVRKPRGVHMNDLEPINRLGFADQEPDTVSGIARELDMPPAPYLLMFLPKELEEKMHLLEEAYRDAKEKQIREKMYFTVVPRGAGYDVIVNTDMMGPPPGKPDLKLKDTLDQNVSIDFAPGPLTEALNYLAERYDFSFKIANEVFNYRSLKNVGWTKVSAPNASGRLADVLQKLLDQANATYRVNREGDGLIIVPK